jgi:tetratricopeptide (TPR) repeat protein
MINPILFADKQSTDFAYACQTRLWRAVGVLVFVLATTGLGASELFDRGAEALLYNRPREAATILEQVVDAEPVNGRAYLYLALSYEQLAMYERAISTLQRAETVPGVDQSTVRFNIGNNYVHLGDVERAYAAYTASLEANPTGVDPRLNRANVNVTREAFEEAIDDYTRVLGLAPDHPQRPQIEQMIALLQEHIEQARIAAEEEAKRLAEEERRREEEAARRLAEEQRRREEAEARRKALLDNVLDSIRTSVDDTENLSAGNEDLDTLDEEFDIAD